MKDSNTWQTRRQKLTKLLKEHSFSVDLRSVMRRLMTQNNKNIDA